MKTITTLAAFAATTASALASSHMDAPLITLDDPAGPRPLTVDVWFPLDSAVDREVDHCCAALAELGCELVDALKEGRCDLQADELLRFASSALRLRRIRRPADEGLGRIIVCNGRLCRLGFWFGCDGHN